MGLYGWKSEGEVRVHCAGKHKQREMEDRAHHFVRTVIFALSFAITSKKVEI